MRRAKAFVSSQAVEALGPLGLGARSRFAAHLCRPSRGRSYASLGKAQGLQPCSRVLLLILQRTVPCVFLTEKTT